MFFNILCPFILAGFIAYLVLPSVEGLEKRGVKRAMSIIFVYLLFLSIVSAMLVLLLPNISRNLIELLDSFPEIMSLYREKVDAMLNIILNSRFPQDIKDSIFNEVHSSIKHFESHSITWLKNMLLDSMSLLPVIIGLLVSIIIAYYYLRDSKELSNAFFYLIPNKYKNDFAIVGREINGILRNFLHGQIITASIVTVLEILGLVCIGVKFPFFLGIIGGLANIVPYFGPIIGAIPATLIALSQSPTKGIWTVLLFLVVQQIDNMFITPRIIEGKLGLHPLVTILAVIAGGQLFGIWGMFLSVPICACVKVVSTRIIERIV